MDLRKLFLLSCLWLTAIDKVYLCEQRWNNHFFTLPNPSRIQKLSNSVLYFQSNITYYLRSVRICSPCRGAPASVAKILLQKINYADLGNPFWTLVTMTGALISPVRWFDRSLMVLRHFPCAYYLQIFGLVNLIIITHDLCPLGFIFTSTWQKNLFGSCLNSYLLGRYCTIRLLVTSIALPSQSETQHWLSPLNLNHRIKLEMPGDVSDNEGIRFSRILFPQWGLCANECMVRNLSKTLGANTESIAKAMAPLEKSLYLLAQVVSDNWIAFDYSLAEQGYICVTTVYLNKFFRTDWNTIVQKPENKPSCYRCLYRAFGLLTCLDGMAS